MTFTCECLHASTKGELRMLASEWTDRMMKGEWFVHHGFRPERVRRTKEGYEIYVEASR